MRAFHYSKTFNLQTNAGGDQHSFYIDATPLASSEIPPVPAPSVQMVWPTPSWAADLSEAQPCDPWGPGFRGRINNDMWHVSSVLCQWLHWAYLFCGCRLQSKPVYALWVGQTASLRGKCSTARMLFTPAIIMYVRWVYHTWPSVGTTEATSSWISRVRTSFGWRRAF